MLSGGFFIYPGVEKIFFNLPGTNVSPMNKRNPILAVAAFSVLAVACNKKNDDGGSSDKLCKNEFFMDSFDSVAVAMPTAFTPNGDGKNDMAGVVILDDANKISNYHFFITNKSGDVVFESSKPGERWDGYINGKRSDDYYFSANLRYTVNGKTIDTCSYLYELRIVNGSPVGVTADCSKYVFEDQINPGTGVLYPTNDDPNCQ